MALIDARKTTRVPIPHEPGEWVELRRLSGGELRRIFQSSADGTDKAITMLRMSVVAWSYAAEPTDETLDQLDYHTMLWMVQQADTLVSGVVTPEEKKDETAPLTGS